MRADMRSIAVQKQLSDMKALGRSLGVGGTPSFFIGDEAVPGGANEDVLNKMIKEELAS
jgi:protein-disulfide isomerase